MKELKVGDILGVAGAGPISRAIRWATRSKGEKDSVLSHVGLVTEGGPISIATLVEAAGGRVREGMIGTLYPHDTLVVVMRPRLDLYERVSIVEHARQKIGERYGFGDIALHLVDRLFGWRWAKRLVTVRKPICSVLVADAFEQNGYSFGLPATYATPDDIYDFAVEHAISKYTFPYGRTPVPLA